MKAIKDMPVEELAAYVCSYLRDRGINVVLSGGSCVSIYTKNKYVSLDLDFIEENLISRRKLKKVLAEIGFFSGKKRYFESSETIFLLEFPPGPPAIGEEPIRDFITLEYPTGKLKIISPTDCVKDRLAAYYHWGDQQGLAQAIAVARDNKIDRDELERWSVGEGKLPVFQKIRKRLADR